MATCGSCVPSVQISILWHLLVILAKTQPKAITRDVSGRAFAVILKGSK